MALGRESSSSQLGYHPYPDLWCQGSQGRGSYVVLPKSCVSRAGFQRREIAWAQKGWAGMVQRAGVAGSLSLWGALAPPGRCEIAATRPGSPLWWMQGAERKGEHLTGRPPAKSRTEVILVYNLFCMDVCTLR